MTLNNRQPEAIQLELLRKTLQGWEPAITVNNKNEWTTEQLEHRFGIKRQELYKIKGKPHLWGASSLIFWHVRKNKWQVYRLNALRSGE